MISHVSYEELLQSGFEEADHAAQRKLIVSKGR